MTKKNKWDSGFDVEVSAQMSALVLKLTGDASVRGITTSNGDQVFSVHEFINVVCQKSGLFSKQLWVRLLRDHKKPPLVHWNVSLRSNDSHPLHEVPAMSMQGLERLLMILDQKVAEEIRGGVEDLFKRYTAGDASMITVAQESVADGTGTKRRHEREDALFNIGLQERLMALQERQVALHERSLALYEKRLALGAVF